MYPPTTGVSPVRTTTRTTSSIQPLTVMAVHLRVSARPGEEAVQSPGMGSRFCEGRSCARRVTRCQHAICTESLREAADSQQFRHARRPMIRIVRSVTSPIRRIRLDIRASWAWASLDREIAEGAPIETSAARRLRAEQLLRPEERCGIAAALCNILDDAQVAPTGAGHRERATVDAILAQRERLRPA